MALVYHTSSVYPKYVNRINYDNLPLGSDVHLHLSALIESRYFITLKWRMLTYL